MKILITGSRGFVGSETTKLLESMYYYKGKILPLEEVPEKDMYIYTRPAYEVIHYDLMDGKDIRDKNQLYNVCHHTKPDRILHLAAIARFADADKDPKLAFETNVEGTRNVVDVAKKLHIPLVYASTGSVYMPIEVVPETGIVETMPAKGNSVYGCTKNMGEYYVKEHTPHIILRYAHLYGKEKRGHGLIGGFVQRISRGLAPTLYGGSQSNDFTYVKDVARANLLALTATWDKWNQTYNIGTGEELSARDAGSIICDAYGYNGEIEIKDQRTVDASRFVYNTAKAKDMLGFEAKYDFKAGLVDMFKEEK